jgi:energy-coupling factor transport system ATP-binding protein
MDIALEQVVFEYPSGVRALDGLDLVIASGQSVGIVGPNGSGKTTLARHLDGLLRPSSGRVLVDGMDIATRRVADLAASVAVGFQDPDRQVFSRSVRAEVEFGPRQLRFSAARRAEAVAQALVTVGLADVFDVHPHDLGEARRKLLTIASLLAMQTPALVLDEPTTGLDAAGVARVQRIIAELQADGRTVIAISHDLRFVAETFDRIVVLERGRIVLDGSPADVFAEDSWPLLRRAGLEPPAAAILGARLGLGSTPSESALLAAAGGPFPRRNRTAT